MDTPTLRFWRRGELVSLGNVPPDRTLLEVLREDLGACGTKEGCGEGDCGACTVVLAEPDGERLRWRAVNSCIRLAHSVDGLAVFTVEDLAGPKGELHPAQEAMVRCHGSQCGFCTPGFVMSLFGMYQNHVAQGREVTRALAQEELSGNLCRCTGYRPILDAAQQMAQLPPAPVDEAALLERLRTLPPATPAPGYTAPETLEALLDARAADPQAQLVAGCTDVGLWVTQQHRRFDRVLDVTRVRELREIGFEPDTLTLGAAVSLTDAFGALVAAWPQLKTFADRFAGLPVRNAGTLGGNVANGSPIGDSMPLLIALGAQVVLARRGGQRQMPLEDFYLGYRQTALAADEVVAQLRVPRPRAGEMVRAYKVSKRFDDDISAVCLAVRLAVGGARVTGARIGCGGVAATPARATRTEAALVGRPWTEDTVRTAIDTIRDEFQPISDMRASAAYRSAVLGNLLQRLWLDSQGTPHAQLDQLPNQVPA